MPKKNMLKKKGAGGGSGGRSGASNAEIPGNGVGSSTLDLEAIGHGLEDLSFMNPDEEVVEVVYIKPSLKRAEWVPFGAPISRDWLRRCIQDSHGAWCDHLSSVVEAAHFTGRLILEAARSFYDVAVGKGLVVVELEEAHTDHGLVGHLASRSAAALTMQEPNMALMERLEDMEKRFDTKLASKGREIEDLHHRPWSKEEDEKLKIEVLNGKIDSLNDNVDQLQTFMKKGLLLSNKVKKRVALTLADGGGEGAWESEARR